MLAEPYFVEHPGKQHPEDQECQHRTATSPQLSPRLSRKTSSGRRALGNLIEAKGLGVRSNPIRRLTKLESKITEHRQPCECCPEAQVEPENKTDEGRQDN